VTSRWEHGPNNGPARKVYAITEAGHGGVGAAHRDWRVFAASIERVLGGGSGEKEGAMPDVQPA
jgi:DNA-binding PadR family transcriptional regulator